MEAIAMPMRWDDFGEAAERCRALRSEVGETMIMEQNAFVETILPQGILQKLTSKEMDSYRAPFLEREARLQNLVWPRQIPVEGEPADVVAIVEEPGVFRINYLRRSSGSQQMPLTDFSAYAFSSLLFLAAHLPRSRFSCDSTPFKNLKAVLAIWSGSAARLSRPISIVRYPLYSHSFNACISPIQSTRPSPGITRPLSDTWTCTKSSRMVRT